MQREFFGGQISCNSMADESFEDAVIVVQEASARITEVSKKLTGLDGQNKELFTALSDLTKFLCLNRIKMRLELRREYPEMFPCTFG